jgi:LDH2 family malate/lactate/ureidoglycolate dehydrogenase
MTLDGASTTRSIPDEGRMPIESCRLRLQIQHILEAWAMPPARAAITADVLLYADLHGIDSHGVSMIPVYEAYRDHGEVRMDAPNPVVSECGPAAALMDAQATLGHGPAAQAMGIAIEKARRIGIGVVAVRNSAHFGAAGYYSRLAAAQGMVGIACTTSPSLRTTPTFGAAPMLGTNPYAFAAPGADGIAFALDMATTTVALGKIRNAQTEGRRLPPGWGTDAHGRPCDDPTEVIERGFLTPLGGTPEGSSYKGYGLAMMVDILAGGLGGTLGTTERDTGREPQGQRNSGHFVLALDPGLFRDRAAFGADVDAYCTRLRSTPPADPTQPVLVAGDPERDAAARRSVEGIPVGPGLHRKLRQVASRAGAPWLLD